LVAQNEKERKQKETESQIKTCSVSNKGVGNIAYREINMEKYSYGVSYLNYYSYHPLLPSLCDNECNLGFITNRAGNTAIERTGLRILPSTLSIHTLQFPSLHSLSAFRGK